ncbi:hypothetical protein FZEAL_9109 [Fusarium zealandicum]|uniref:Protein kinase domain-containing protein n=1 Tax=Fusarium zealandicum TaxID=1053134 RepID=A0A8H4XG62_9HYPO|nr:hypothetical protein FZEAL_9109 [Fusarium zealandicum]
MNPSMPTRTVIGNADTDKNDLAEREQYLSLDRLKALVNPTSAKKLLESLGFSQQDVRELVKGIFEVAGYSGSNTEKSQRGPKERPTLCRIFTILIIMQRAPAIQHFVRNNINDSVLPLTIEQRFGGYDSSALARNFRIQSLSGGDADDEESHPGYDKKLQQCFSDFDRLDVESFCGMQKKVHVPFLQFPGDNLNVCFYDLDSDCILPFTELGNTKRGGEVFPWADGNLKEYWATHTRDPGNYDDVCWFFKQCLGLVTGLRRIHDPLSFARASGSNGISSAAGKSPMIPDDKYGRHGDIKPENILWFIDFDGDKDHLTICDFGLARFNSIQSKSRVDPKDIDGFSDTYQPPDCFFKEKLVNPSYDIWSLACVFLEFISWFLIDYKHTKVFSKKRLASDPQFPRLAITDDRFFHLDWSGENETAKSAKVKRSVLEGCYEDVNYATDGYSDAQRPTGKSQMRSAQEREVSLAPSISRFGHLPRVVQTYSGMQPPKETDMEELKRELDRQLSDLVPKLADMPDPCRPEQLVLDPDTIEDVHHRSGVEQDVGNNLEAAQQDVTESLMTKSETVDMLNNAIHSHDPSAITKDPLSTRPTTSRSTDETQNASWDPRISFQRERKDPAEHPQRSGSGRTGSVLTVERETAPQRKMPKSTKRMVQGVKEAFKTLGRKLKSPRRRGRGFRSMFQRASKRRP